MPGGDPHGPDLLRPRRNPGGSPAGHAALRPAHLRGVRPALPRRREQVAAAASASAPGELFAGAGRPGPPGGGPGTLLGPLRRGGHRPAPDLRRRSCSCSPGSSTRGTSSTWSPSSPPAMPGRCSTSSTCCLAFDDVFGSRPEPLAAQGRGRRPAARAGHRSSRADSWSATGPRIWPPPRPTA